MVQGMMRGCPDRTEPTIRPSNVFIHAGLGIVTRFAELSGIGSGGRRNVRMCASALFRRDVAAYRNPRLTGRCADNFPSSGRFAVVEVGRRRAVARSRACVCNRSITERTLFTNERSFAARRGRHLVHSRRKCLLFRVCPVLSATAAISATEGPRGE